MSHVFYADAVLFDMDGTLTDSIAAVEAAWGKVARDLGLDPKHVISATHGKRAIDNLLEFKPNLKPHEMDDEVRRFEETILYYADAYQLRGQPHATHPLHDIQVTPSSPEGELSPIALSPTLSDENDSTPFLTPTGGSTNTTTTPMSSQSSLADESNTRPSSFGARLLGLLRMSASQQDIQAMPHTEEDNLLNTRLIDHTDGDGVRVLQSNDIDEAWKKEAAAVDRSVRILPGVKKLMDSLPVERYAIATSGARTYALGCMSRVGIVPPPVTITADDKRLKNGKPAPDPFLLAAGCLGYDAARCVVFEDSPSGIKAGLASGATVVAVCTSHERKVVEEAGAHYVIDDLEAISCDFLEEEGVAGEATTWGVRGRIRFSII